MKLHEEVWSSRKVYWSGTGHARGQYDSGEVFVWNNRWVAGESGTPSRFSSGLQLVSKEIDTLTDKVRLEPPWTMMFASDIVNCSEIKELEEESWRGDICTRERRNKGQLQQDRILVYK